MPVPPYLILDGYKDRDLTGKDFTKPGSGKMERKETYQYFIPMWRGYLYESKELVGSPCAFFEAQFFKCQEAFGPRLSYLYCDLEHRDMSECSSHQKKLNRLQAIKDVRFKQWLRGERKHQYEPIENYLAAVAPGKGGMHNHSREKRKKEEAEIVQPKQTANLA